MSDLNSSSPSTSPMVCYNHPKRETLLRCNRCERPMCIQCAVQTPTGYRCKACINSHQKVYATSLWYDYPIAGVVAILLAFFGSWIAEMGFLIIFLAPIIGIIISEVVRWLVRRRRSVMLVRITTICSAVGSVPVLIMVLINLFRFLSFAGATNVMIFLPLLWQGVYTILVASTVYYRMGGSPTIK